MRIFCATVLHESSSFSPIPTSIENFKECVLYRPSTGEGRELLGSVVAEVDHVSLLGGRGHEPVVGLIANAEPSQPVVAADYQLLCDELLLNLRRAGPIDGVLLFLHGAQMAEGVPDCTSDIVSHVRRLVGPDVRIAVELDLHCNVGDALLDHADIVLACLEYPHIDFATRAHQALVLLEQAVAGVVDPVRVIERIPLLGVFPTDAQPMRALVDRAIGLEGRDGILAVSVCHGFTGADSPDTGAAILIVADRGSVSLARQHARDLAGEFWAIREAATQRRVPALEAIKCALSCTGRPVVLADTTDNPGSGAAGDSTFLLHSLLQWRVTNAALAMIWDPVAAQTAARCGLHQRLKLRLGGKSGPASGDPLDVEATVTAINPGASQLSQGAITPLGLTVALDVAGIAVVVNSIRQQTFSPMCFTELGIDPRGKRLLVVKSTQHFRETFGPFAAQIIYVAGPPGLPVDYRSYEYRHLTRPIWPLDALPFQSRGRQWS